MPAEERQGGPQEPHQGSAERDQCETGGHDEGRAHPMPAPRLNASHGTDAARLPYPAEFVGHVVRTVRPVVGSLREALPHEAVQQWRRERLECRDGRRLLLHDCRHEAHRARALERPLTGQALVEDRLS